MNVEVSKAKPADLVAEFIQLRKAKQEFEALCEDKGKELYGDRMKEIELQLLAFLNETGADSIASKKGTAYKKLSVSVTIADPREFRRHVIGTEAWDLADWRANKTQINEMVERGEELPPGINRTQFYNIGIRSK